MKSVLGGENLGETSSWEKAVRTPLRGRLGNHHPQLSFLRESNFLRKENWGVEGWKQGRSPTGTSSVPFPFPSSIFFPAYRLFLLCGRNNTGTQGSHTISVFLSYYRHPVNLILTSVSYSSQWMGHSLTISLQDTEITFSVINNVAQKLASVHICYLLALNTHDDNWRIHLEKNKRHI